MRRLLVLALVAAPTAATAQHAKLMKLQDDSCVRMSDRVGALKQRPKAKAAPRKLGELPPAHGYYAVYREAGGCPVPAAVADEPRKR